MPHDISELRQMQSLPLAAKETMAINRINEWYEYCNGNVFVSFSGGKDSTALLHLVRSIYPDVPAVFADTGLEHPEIREFVKTIDNVTVVRPEINFREVLKEYGYPVVSKDVSKTIYYARRGGRWAQQRLKGLNNDDTPSRWRASHYSKWTYLLDAPFKISDHCCTVIKKRPIQRYEKATGRLPYLGTIAEESVLRTQAWLQTGCNVYEGAHKKSTPLAFWTEQDILRYISNNDLLIASCYGNVTGGGTLRTTGVDRTGCMFCMFGVHLEQSPNRFERMRETHPKQYDYCMRPFENGGLGMEAVLSFLNIKH